MLDLTLSELETIHDVLTEKADHYRSTRWEDLAAELNVLADKIADEIEAI